MEAGERELKLVELIEHPNWRFYEAEIAEWISDAQALLETAGEHAELLRLQGNIEALRHVLDFRNKWEGER